METCSARHKLRDICPSCDEYHSPDSMCPPFEVRDSRKAEKVCIYGTPIGQECKEGPQPEKVDGASWSMWANSQAFFLTGMAKTSFGHDGIGVDAYRERVRGALTESAEIRGKELESENGRLKSLLGKAMTGLDWWEQTHPESQSEADDEFKQEVAEATALTSKGN